MSRIICPAFAISLVLSGQAIMPAQELQVESRLEYDERPPSLFVEVAGRSKNPVNKALKHLQAADSNAARAEATDHLRQALGEEYDRLMEQEEAKLTKLEKRLEKLRDQLRRRRDAKRQMVDLRMQVLVSESEGLGWPGGGRHRGLFAPEDGVWSRFPMPDPPPAVAPVAAEPARVR